MQSEESLRLYDLSCILHAHQHHVLKRLGTDLLRLMQHLLKGGGPMLSPQVGSQEPGGVQKLNIGSGNAATALSQLLGRSIDMQVPQVRLMDVA